MRLYGNGTTPEEARAECDRCKGRTFGDCSDQCRYWGLTCTAAEREAAQKQKDNHDASRVTEHRKEKR